MDARVIIWVVVVGTLAAEVANAQVLPWRRGQERLAARSMEFSPGRSGPARDNERGSEVRGPYRADSLSTQTPDANVAARRSDAVGEEFAAAKVIARVGDEVILAGDVMGQVNQFLHQRLQALPPEQRDQIPADQLDQQRWKVVQQLLPQLIDSKLVYLDFLRTIPPDKVPELQDSLYRAFDEQRLPALIESTKVKSAAELDSMLRGFGSSLSQQRRAFAEQVAAAQWRKQNGGGGGEITHDDMLAYYHKHREEYQIQAKCRWEQLSALDAETGSREKSRQLVAKMGNEVFHGASFAAVAKRSSHGLTADNGGKQDWTTKGSLRSDVLDRTIFSIETGKLSRILEDDQGCHIVRVTERSPAGYVRFTEVQREIRQQIKQTRAEDELKQYVEGLRKQFPVWTMFDDETTNAD